MYLSSVGAGVSITGAGASITGSGTVCSTLTKTKVVNLGSGSISSGLAEN